MRKIFTGQGFTLGLFVSLFLAYWFPLQGLPGGALRTEITTPAAVIVIFLLQGLNLSGSALRRGLSAWKLHLFVQVFGFVFLPLVTWFCVERGWVAHEIAPGLLFLAILPTTISTSVVYSAAAGGDSPAATFCAALSNLLSVFVVPAWSAVLIFPRLNMAATGADTDAFLGHFLWELFWLIVFPLIIGVFGRRFCVRFVEGNEARLRRFCFGCVLFIAYAGFCKGFAEGTASLEDGIIFQLVSWAIGFLLFANLSALLVLRFFRLPWPQVITGFFAATQKSLAVGLPMAYLLFDQSNPRLFLILLPLILVHPLQLLLGSILCSRLRGMTT